MVRSVTTALIRRQMKSESFTAPCRHLADVTYEDDPKPFNRVGLLVERWPDDMPGSLFSRLNALGRTSRSQAFIIWLAIALPIIIHLYSSSRRLYRNIPHQISTEWFWKVFYASPLLTLNTSNGSDDQCPKQRIHVDDFRRTARTPR